MKTEKFEELFKEEYEKNSEKVKRILEETVKLYFDEDCKASLEKALAAFHESAYVASCQFTHDVLKRMLCEEEIEVEK